MTVSTEPPGEFLHPEAPQRIVIGAFHHGMKPRPYLYGTRSQLLITGWDFVFLLGKAISRSSSPGCLHDIYPQYVHQKLCHRVDSHPFWVRRMLNSREFKHDRLRNFNHHWFSASWDLFGRIISFQITLWRCSLLGYNVPRIVRLTDAIAVSFKTSLCWLPCKWIFFFF